MLPSFHDDYLVGYEVDCEARQIKLHIKPADSAAERAHGSTVVFTGVEGYDFEGDAFGNIILGLVAWTTTEFLSQYRGDLAEAYHMSGAPGAWAADLDAAPRFLSEQGIQAFVLGSSYGLSGWVLAREVCVVPRNGVLPSGSAPGAVGRCATPLDRASDSNNLY
jgi:hypothetical protein